MRIAVITQDDTFYIGRFFETFLDTLPPEIDLRAADLQARGIPIVCNDVPPISPYSEKLLQMYEDMRGSPH